MISLFRRYAALLALLTLALPARAAIDEDELLPIEEAFALSAVATERGRIEFTWRVADGYYLYRHRMAVQPVDAGFKFNPLELPPGEKATDEFFGEVETYRGSVTAVLTGAAASGVERLEFNVRYQGCADVGVCYPPHQQRVTVSLPPEAARPAPADGSGAAAVSGDPLFGGPAGAASSALTGGSEALFGGGASGAVESLPLPADQAFAFEAIASAPRVLLLRFTPAPGYYLYRDRSSFRIVGARGVAALTPAWPPAEQHTDDHFGAVAVYFDQVEVPLPLERSDGSAQTIVLEATFQGCQTDGICYPPMTRQVQVALPEASAAELASPSGSPEVSRPDAAPGFLLALLLALGGGLILNLMPCVLPVLSLKALSLADSGRSGGHARASALWYTAGVLASFALVGAAALALRAAGAALGWGFQLQQPGVVAGLALLMTAIGLNLSGVYSFGGALAGVGQGLTEKPGRSGDFFTGVLAVVVASPCTAPFMGTALAFAFAAPVALALAVFLALGLGLALPFLLIGFIPALARLLPRPGAWMDSFKQVLAFPMYFTAVWLLWVLGKQRGVDALGLALAGAVLLGAGLWWWGRQGLARAPLARSAAVLVILLGAGAALWVQRMAPAQAVARDASDGSVAYSETGLAELRQAGRVVFVNMTADWCVTCKANEKRVIATEAFRSALAGVDAVYMKGDWTNVDPAITRFLEAHGAVGVPLYVVFPRGGGEGQVLATVLTQAEVDTALARAAR